MNQLSREARLLLELAQGADDPDARTQARIERLLSARLAAGGAPLATPRVDPSKAVSAGLSPSVQGVVVALGIGGALAGLGWVAAGHTSGTPSAFSASPAKATAIATASLATSAPPLSASPPLRKLQENARAPARDVERTPNVNEAPPEATSPARAVATAKAPALPAPKRPSEPADNAARADSSNGASQSELDPAPALDPLAAEAAALRDAQRALRDGQTSRALELIATQDARFAHGSLQQERAAARVLALCQAGSREKARAEATRFAERWPRSALLTRVQAACRTP